MAAPGTRNPGHVPASAGTPVGYVPASPVEEPSFELTGESRIASRNPEGRRVSLRRIRALRDIPAAGVQAGDLGGWVESTHLADGTLRLQDDAWVFDDAEVHGNAVLRHRAQARHSATVRGNVVMEGDSRALDRAHLHGVTRLRDRARAADQSELAGGDLSGDVIVAGDAKTHNHVRLSEHFRLDDAASVFDRFQGFGHGHLTGSAVGGDDAMVGGDAVVTEYAHVGGEAFLTFGDRLDGFERLHSNHLSIGDSIRVAAPRKAA